MTDQRPPDELERRLASALRHADLPGAPAGLRDALERIPDAPVVGGRARAGADGRRTGSGWGLLGLAAALVLGGALAVGVGSRGPAVPPDAEASPLGPTPPFVTRITYQAQWTAARPESAADIQTIEAVLRRRLEGTGMAGTRVDSLGGGRFVVELPSGPAVEAARGILGVTGDVAFVPLGEQAANVGDRIEVPAAPLFGSEGISGATVGEDQTGARVITIALTPAAAGTFGAWTARNIGSYLAITVDGIVLSAPVIQSEIPGGQVQVSQGGEGWDPGEAKRIAAVLSSGPLPVSIQEVGVEPAPPSPVATAPVGPSPSPLATRSPAVEPTFALNRAPGDLGCDSVMPPYRSFVFQLDPSADEPVWADAITGPRLRVEWGAGFRGLVGPPAVVVDRQGLVVAQKGTTVEIPDGAWPLLAGHFVCPSTTTIYVFDEAAPA